MLTQKDLDKIKKLMALKVKEAIRLLPTRDEFYGKMDEVMGELKAIRQIFEDSKIPSSHLPGARAHLEGASL